jgi:hypothetical protein
MALEEDDAPSNSPSEVTNVVASAMVGAGWLVLVVGTACASALMIALHPLLGSIQKEFSLVCLGIVGLISFLSAGMGMYYLLRPISVASAVVWLIAMAVQCVLGYLLMLATIFVVWMALGGPL